MLKVTQYLSLWNSLHASIKPSLQQDYSKKIASVVTENYKRGMPSVILGFCFPFFFFSFSAETFVWMWFKEAFNIRILESFSCGLEGIKSFFLPQLTPVVCEAISLCDLQILLMNSVALLWLLWSDLSFLFAPLHTHTHTHTHFKQHQDSHKDC